jgi:hypothetical protein
MMYVVYDVASGAAFSIGTVLADPMPDVFSVYACEPQESAGLLSGELVWDAVTLSVVQRPPDVEEDDV